MSNTDPRIAILEQQIASLSEELRVLKKQSKSIWNTVFSSFIGEGNDEDVAQLWADQFSEIMLSWVNDKRAQLSQRLISTGEMPPYTECLNELTVDLTPPGSQPAVLDNDYGTQGSIASAEPYNTAPPPPLFGSPQDGTGVTPKMQRVYVPTPFDQMPTP